MEEILEKKRYNYKKPVIRHLLKDKITLYFKIEFSRYPCYDGTKNPNGPMIHTRLLKLTKEGAEYIQLGNDDRAKKSTRCKNGTMTYISFLAEYGPSFKNGRLIEIPESTYKLYHDLFFDKTKIIKKPIPRDLRIRQGDLVK